MAESTTTEDAVDRARRLMSAGADIVHATNDAAHHFNCSARLVRAAVQARAGSALAAQDQRYLQLIATPATAREVAARLGKSGTAIGGVAAHLSRLVRRDLATFDGARFQAKP